MLRYVDPSSASDAISHSAVIICLPSPEAKHDRAATMNGVRRFFVLAALLAACVSSTPIQSVRDADQRRFRAMTANDLDTLAALLSADLVYVHSDATSESKEEFLQRLRSGSLRYHSIEPMDIIVRSYGRAAVVTGRAKIDVTNAAVRRMLDMRYTAVDRANGGRWQLVSWQSTRIAQ